MYEKYSLFISSFILGEITEKLAKKFHLKTSEIKRIQNFLQDSFLEIKPTNTIPNICRDIDDNQILQLASFVKADFLITGDKDLLVLEHYLSVSILSPRDFMKKFYTE